MPKPVLRVSVVDGPIALSSVWAIWCNKGDVYAGVRTIAGRFKTSLHASHRFRHAFTSDAEAARFRPTGADRAVMKWSRPAEQLSGATLLFQINIPGIGLEGKLLKYPLPKRLVALTRPTADELLRVSIVETSADTITKGPQMTADGSTKLLAQWPLTTGGTLWIVSHVEPLSAQHRASIEQIHALARHQAQANVAAIHDNATDDPSELRGFYLLTPDKGVGQVLDLSFEFLRRELPRSTP